MIKKLTVAALIVMMAAPTMAQKYHVTKMSRERILIDKHYAADKDAEAFLAPYKHQVDSVMSPVIGKTASYMKASYPEDKLNNLLADILVWCGTQYNEKVDIGIQNVGGIRAALPEGDITFGDIVNVAPFENKICFVSLTGAQLKILFQQMWNHYGAALSHGVEVTVSMSTRKVMSLKYNGEEIDDSRSYRIATIDYLLQGNDGFGELQNGFDVNSPQDMKSNTRFLFAEYFRQCTSRGELIDAPIEGRVVFVE